MSNAVPDNKILFVAPTAYPLGGVAVWLHYLLSGLNHNGWNVSLGAVEGKFHDASKYLEHYDFANVVSIKNPTATEYGRARAIAKAIEKHQIDLVVSVNIPDVYRAVRRLPTKGHRQIRTVATIHGLIPQLFQDLSTYIDVIDEVIVTNRLTEAMVIRMTDFPPEHVFYAPYGVALGEPREINRPTKTLRILYSGRIENEQKRCADLIQIVRSLELAKLDYVLRIAGDGPYREELLQELTSFMPSEKLEYLGFVPAEEMHNEVYRQSDVLLLTSEWETGPIVIWEAMAQGVAVVTSRYKGSVSEGSLKHGSNCLMFEVGDTADAAKQILSLGTGSQLKDLAAEGYRLVRDNYSKSGSIAAWESALTEIMAVPAPRKNHMKNQYVARGAIEKIFGVRIGDRIRQLLNKQAFTASAGDEWPHTHGNLNAEYVQCFESTLNEQD